MNRTRPWFLVSVAAVVAVAATILVFSGRHKSAAAETIRRMQDCACAGDVACFFARVDRDAILHFATDTLRARHPYPPFEPSVARTDPNVVPSYAAVEPEARKKVDLLFADWEKDIARAKVSTLCRMHVVEPRNPDQGLIDVWMPTGKRTWLLSLMEDGPVVVGLADEPLHAP